MDWTKETYAMIYLWETAAKRELEMQAEWARIAATNLGTGMDIATAAISWLQPLSDVIRQSTEVQIELLQNCTQATKNFASLPLWDIQDLWKAWSSALHKASEKPFKSSSYAQPRKRQSADKASQAA